MKTGTLSSMTSFSLLLIVSFSLEASAKRGCSAFGHSCFGGHGKRSDPDGQQLKQSFEVDPVNLKTEPLDSSNEVSRFALSSDEIQQLQDFVECRNRAIEMSRRARVQPSIPLLIGKWLTSYRRPYEARSETDDK